jgi:glyoxylase-like metal-dependent hydrolase (beta-lactamase superfamily II)
VGPLPWQGISCLDVSAAGLRIVVGTIAPPGDPNVIVLNDQGKVVAQHTVGQRWISDVAWGGDGKHVFALSTMPAGKAGDFPTVFRCGEEVVPMSVALGEAGWPTTIFHYGDHSNHCGTILRPYSHGNEAGSVLLVGDQVHWLPNKDELAGRVNFPRPGDAVSVSLTVAPSGEAIVSCAVSAPEQGDPPANLFVLKRGQKQPLWSRPAYVSVADSAALEKGEYGTPTLPDGTRELLPQRDVKVYAPLSTAVYAPGDEIKLIATADYQGWQRWIRSSATLKEQNYGTRFLPSKPTVTIYDSQGRLVRRFLPALFGQPEWLDLEFLPGGKQLVAYPHQTKARGLAGQSILPADDEDARWLYRLDIESGKVDEFEFPDAISDVAVTDSGRIAVSCWDGRVYFDWIEAKRNPVFLKSAGKRLLEALSADVGGPALLAAPRDVDRIFAATTSGQVFVFDTNGKELAKTDLNQAIPRAEKSWVTKAKAEPIVPGLWNLPGGRVESDLGGQRVIQAPDGLILIEAHAGLSFEREWAAIESAGLDPRKVKYVLATHEHGDHAPGAYLWRVVTGAQFICSREMAYTLRHHAPLCSGYGFHPPNPTDIVIDADRELDLAGQKVVALRLPGHTFGAMGWLFEKDGQRFVATGDLIMPEGVLGYSGSINFSATDVLGSLRKLDGLRVDSVLPGHGPIGDPNRYIAAGIGVGRHVGWGKMRPEEPDPRYRLSQANVLVVGWNIDATSADFADMNADGRPDVAVVTPASSGSAVKIFINQGGRFSAKADLEVAVPQVANPRKLRLRHLNDDRVPDIFVAGDSAALRLSRGPVPDNQVIPFDLNDGHLIHRVQLTNDSRPIIVNRAFGSYQTLAVPEGGRARLETLQPTVAGPFADLREVDLNGDGHSDWITSSGNVYLRGVDGRIPMQPSHTLRTVDPSDWQFLAVGDFNGDHKPDVVLLSYGMRATQGAVHLNTGRADRPFDETPSAKLDFPNEVVQGKKTQYALVRDTPPVADFNGDGIDDLVIGKGQDNHVTVLLGAAGGLSTDRSLSIALDYHLQFNNTQHVADFNGDGRADFAALGYTKTGVGSTGPTAVYIWLQE